MSELPLDVREKALGIVQDLVARKQAFDTNNVLKLLGYNSPPLFYWSLSQELYNRYSHGDKLFANYGYHWFDMPEGARIYFPLPESVLEKIEEQNKTAAPNYYSPVALTKPSSPQSIATKQPYLESNVMTLRNRFADVLASFVDAQRIFSSFEIVEEVLGSDPFPLIASSMTTRLVEMIEIGHPLLHDYCIHWRYPINGLKIFYPVPDELKRAFRRKSS